MYSNNSIAEYQHQQGMYYEPTLELIQTGWTPLAVYCYSQNECHECSYKDICNKFRMNNCEPPIKGVVRKLLQVYGDPKLNNNFISLLTTEEILICCYICFLCVGNVDYKYCLNALRLNRYQVESIVKSIKNKITPRLLLTTVKSVSIKSIKDYLRSNCYDDLLISWKDYCHMLQIDFEVRYEKEQ